MSRLGFYFDERKCLGCRTCQVACKDKNELEVGVLFRRVRSFETGRYPEATLYHYSGSCNHCENPGCMAACPTGAVYRAEDGTVQIDTQICDGCGKCAEICPYQVPQYIEEEGVVRKCNACLDLRLAGKNPACVDACYMRALDFGELEELEKKYEGDWVDELPFLPEATLTSPSLRIRPKACAGSMDYEEVEV